MLTNHARYRGGRIVVDLVAIGIVTLSVVGLYQCVYQYASCPPYTHGMWSSEVQ